MGGNAVSGTFLTAAIGGAGVFNFGTITTLTNTGTIGGGAGAHSGHGGTGIFNQGVITALSSSGKITGGAGGDVGPGGVGLLNSYTGVNGGNSGTIGTLTTSGVISGGAGGGFVGAGGDGGDGLVNAVKSTIDELQVYAQGKISGGAGGQGGAKSISGGVGANGGVGLANQGTITTLTNGGKIDGGLGGNDAAPNPGGRDGSGGAGLTNSGTINSLQVFLSGSIAGGNGGSATLGGQGGTGVNNSHLMTILTNRGTITGGAGGAGAEFGGAGGDGVLNSGTIGNLRTGAGGLNNGGKIYGGFGGSSGGAGGGAVVNSGTISSLINNGTVQGGEGGRSGGQGGAGVIQLARDQDFQEHVHDQRGPRRHGRAIQRRRSGRDGYRELGHDHFPTNSGTISGGDGGAGTPGGAGGSTIWAPSARSPTLESSRTAVRARAKPSADIITGASIDNSGSIGSFTNDGLIENSLGGLAIDSADGSIASLVNDGRMRVASPSAQTPPDQPWANRRQPDPGLRGHRKRRGRNDQRSHRRHRQRPHLLQRPRRRRHDRRFRRERRRP